MRYINMRNKISKKDFINHNIIVWITIRAKRYISSKVWGNLERIQKILDVCIGQQKKYGMIECVRVPVKTGGTMGIDRILGYYSWFRGRS